MQNIINKFKKNCKEHTFHLIAFAIPVLAMLVVYYFKDIAPFGDQMYLRSDCFHQYAPFLQVLQDKLRNFGNFYYSWEFGGGMNYWGLGCPEGQGGPNCPGSGASGVWSEAFL